MNKHFSDYLPAVMVKDLRQAFRSRGYVLLILLCAAGAWLEQLSVWNKGGENGSWLIPLLLFVFVFCMPWRAAAAVQADTKVKGTNFLMLTPITSRRIVWSVWASTMVQMVLAALLFAPLAAYRVLHAAPDDLFPSLLCLLPALCALVTALQMFASRLHVLLRLGILFGLFAKVCSVFFDSQTLMALLLHQGEGRLLLTAWQYGGMVALAVLAVVLMLEFTRRYYAPLSENCSVGYRAVLPLVFAVGAALCLLNQAHISYEVTSTPPAMGGMFMSPAMLPSSAPVSVSTVSMVHLEVMAALLILLAALADAVMPSCRIPAHDRRCVSWLPKVLQVPGLAAATLWLVIALVLASAMEVVPAVTVPVVAKDLQASAVTAAQNLPTAAYPLLLTLLLTDVFCKRESTRRPVVYCVLYVLVGVLGTMVMDYYLMDGHVVEGISAWHGLLPLPAANDDWKLITPEYHCLRAAACAAVVGILLYRGRLKNV